ncbi:MAG: TAXI family TRAP transporter solute-binding subunit [Burkholderiaceae bacterium]
MSTTRIRTQLAAIAVAVMCGTAPAKAEIKSLTIGTNPSGTVFYLLGGGFAKLFQQELKIRSVAQPNGGASVYLPLLDNGEMSLGMVSSIESALAYSGTAPFNKPMSNVRALAMVWNIPYAFIVREDSGIRSVAELKGKKVMITMPTNASLTNLNIASLKTGGLTEQDVTAMTSGGLIKGVEAVTEGRADAAPIATAVPALSKAHNSVPGGLRILPMGDAVSDAEFSAMVPGVSMWMHPPMKSRPYVRDKTKVALYGAYLNISGSMADDDAYLLTKTVHENWEKFQKDYPPTRGVKQNQLAPVPNAIPYHNGAVRFYKEAGLWTADHDKAQASLLK